MEEEEPKVIKTNPHSNQKYYQKQITDPKFEIDKELYHSNSANDLLDLKENKTKIKSERSKKKKHPHLYRSMSAKTFFDHYDLKNCEYCQGIDNLLKLDKSNLSSFIQKNPSFLKLFGNPRYNKSSPFLFVEDHKNRVDDERIGLLPIPSKPKLIMKSKDEKNNLYEIQRQIVMMRRFQYGKKYNEEMLLNNEENEDFFQKIRTIQLWWKQMYKIIYIKQIFRGFRIRKRVDFIISGYDGQDGPGMIIVELKQWDSITEVKGADALVETYVGGGNHRVVHPSYQAWSYAQLIRDYNQEVQNRSIGLYPCACLHNYIRHADDPLDAG